MISFFRRLSDERYKRAQRRRRTEEIMGWICVPVLLLIGWSAWRAWDDLNTNRRTGPEVTLPPTTTIIRN